MPGIKIFTDTIALFHDLVLEKRDWIVEGDPSNCLIAHPVDADGHSFIMWLSQGRMEMYETFAGHMAGAAIILHLHPLDPGVQQVIDGTPAMVAIRLRLEP